MSIVLDTSVLIAAMNTGERFHDAAAELLRSTTEDLVTTPMALAEMDHYAASQGGRSIQEALWKEFDTGVFAVRWWADGLRESIEIARANETLGLTDASLVALADRQRTTRIATLDAKHFAGLTTRDGRPFVLLPNQATETRARVNAASAQTSQDLHPIPRKHPKDRYPA